MRRLLLVLLLAVAVLAMAAALNGFELNRLLNPGLYARFGNFGGGPRPAGPPEPFDPQALKYGIRWFPTHVHFGPDNDTLLVSLCHVSRPDFCRIGKYRISDKHWDVLPFEETRTYRTPIFSPDGHWIVVSTAPCNDQRLCDARDHQLMKMLPDGSRMELVADSSALYPSFSHDGRKLIYWRWRVIVTPGQPKYAAGVDLYQLEWATGKESPLLGFGFIGDFYGRPFFTPDGQRFLFAANLEHAMFGGGPQLFGEENKGVCAFLGSVEEAPIGKANYKTLGLVWPGPTDSTCNLLDIDRQGRLLYSAGIAGKRAAGNPAAVAIRPPNASYRRPPPLSLAEEQARDRWEHDHPMTDEQYRRGEGVRKYLNKIITGEPYQKGEGSALFLRKPMAEATDEAAFDVSGCSLSLSGDSTRLAFVWGGCHSAMPEAAIGLVGVGQQMRQATFLDWPKLDLIPAQSTKP